MKRILFVVAAMIISFNGYSQFFEIGPRFEVTSTKFQLDRTVITDDGVEKLLNEASRDLGFKAGLYTRFKIGSIYLQPEVLFTSTGGKIEYDGDLNAVGQQIIDLNYNRIDVPIMLGKKFGKVFRFNLGPILSYTVSNKAELPGAVEKIKENYNEAVIGYQLGIGLDISKIRLDVKYESNFTQFGESIRITDDIVFPTEYRPNMFTFGLAFNIL
ncbi:MAG: outer membrane beta-barrel protein [Cyclobacteriaceae bacterium]